MVQGAISLKSLPTHTVFCGVTAAPFEVVVVPINDLSTANLLDELDMCCAFISRARASRGTVLVHCMAGIPRRYPPSLNLHRQDLPSSPPPHPCCHLSISVQCVSGGSVPDEDGAPLPPCGPSHHPRGSPHHRPQRGLHPAGGCDPSYPRECVYTVSHSQICFVCVCMRSWACITPWGARWRRSMRSTRPSRWST